MNWIKYEGQKFNVGDLLWLEKGKIAFVDGDNKNIPTIISSIPSGWDFDLNVRYENILAGLNEKGELYDVLGEYVDKILYYASYPEILDKEISKLDGRGDYDYVEITFYKDSGKMNFVEHLLIPIFLNEKELVSVLKEKFGDIVYNSNIVIEGEYYKRLIKNL